ENCRLLTELRPAPDDADHREDDQQHKKSGNPITRCSIRQPPDGPHTPGPRTQTTARLNFTSPLIAARISRIQCGSPVGPPPTARNPRRSPCCTRRPSDGRQEWDTGGYAHPGRQGPATRRGRPRAELTPS